MIAIIDDDGTTGTDDDHTGIRTFLHNKNIPLTYAVPSAAAGEGGKMTLATLKSLVNDGDEVVMHGVTDDDNVKTCSLAEFQTIVDTSIEWAQNNGFTSDVFVYPQGLQPSTGVDVNAKIAYLQSKNVKLAFNVNTSAEASETEGFEDWYTYPNGHTYKGIYNKLPLVEMPNNYNKAFLVNRAEINKTTNISLAWWKKKIDDLSDTDVFMCFFIHSYRSEFSTPDTSGKTATDYFKDTINYIVDNYSDKVKFVTASGLKNM